MSASYPLTIPALSYYCNDDGLEYDIMTLTMANNVVMGVIAPSFFTLDETLGEFQVTITDPEDAKSY